MATITSEITEYKTEIKDLESRAKIGDALVKISEASENVYDTFNELLMDLSQNKDETKEKGALMQVYKLTRKLLIFIENNIDPDFCAFLFKKSSYFKKLYEHCSIWCSKIEKKYDLQLEIERNLST